MAKESKQPTSAAEQKAAPKIEKHDSGRPGGGAGRRDVVEPIPGNVHVDPDITEGHPGYEESGDSEIIQPDRLASGGTKPKEPHQRGTS